MPSELQETKNHHFVRIVSRLRFDDHPFRYFHRYTDRVRRRTVYLLFLHTHGSVRQYGVNRVHHVEFYVRLRYLSPSSWRYRKNIKLCKQKP